MMATSLLIFDENIRSRIKEIVEHSHANPLSLQDVKDTMAGKKEAIGSNNPKHVIHLFNGFRVVYSEEYQPKGLYRHISISKQGKEQIPHPVACKLILEEFGFKTPLPQDPMEWFKGEAFIGWLDEENDALNFLEKYDQ